LDIKGGIKMKRLLIIVLAVIMLIGCSAPRTAITVEEFIAKAEAAGYTVENRMTEETEKAGFVKEAYVAYKNSYEIPFAVASTLEGAKEVSTKIIDLYKEMNNTYKKSGAATASTEVTRGNYAYYYLTADGKYTVFSALMTHT